jgi:hypothetical protein
VPSDPFSTPDFDAPYDRQKAYKQGVACIDGSHAHVRGRGAAGARMIESLIARMIDSRTSVDRALSYRVGCTRTPDLITR